VDEFAVYRGDTLLVIGTAVECAAFMGWKNPAQTLMYSSPSWHNRKVKNPNKAIVTIRIEED